MTDTTQWRATLTPCSSSGGTGEQGTYPLEQQALLGRESDCLVAVDSKQYPTVSKYHAQLVQVASNPQPVWQIHDLNSSNGTYVNETRLLGQHTLKTGDRITLSRNGPEFLFECSPIISPQPPLQTNEAASSQSGKSGSTIVSSSDSVVEAVSGRKTTIEVSTKPEPIQSFPSKPSVSTSISATETQSKSLWTLLTEESVQVLSGHSSQVRSVTFRADGRILASGSADKTIKLWDVKSGIEIRNLAGHKLTVNTIAFSPDGLMLASGSADKTIKLWDVTTGEEIRTFTGHGLAVNAIAFSPDGVLLASGSADKTVKLWEVSIGRERQTLTETKMAVSAIAFSPDGATLGVASTDRSLKLWNIPTGAEQEAILGLRSTVTALQFSPDGQALAICADDKLIRLWDLEANREIRAIAGYSWQVGSMAISFDGQKFASGSEDNSVRVWQL